MSTPAGARRHARVVAMVSPRVRQPRTELPVAFCIFTLGATNEYMCVF